MPPVPQTGVPSDLLHRRPDIRKPSTRSRLPPATSTSRRSCSTRRSRSAVLRRSADRSSDGEYPNLAAGAGGAREHERRVVRTVRVFSVIGQLVQPIFNGGKIHSQIHLSEAQQQQITIQYLQTVHRAFEEVSDDVAAYNDSRARTQQLQLYETASVDSVRLAQERYENGYTVVSRSPRRADARVPSPDRSRTGAAQRAARASATLSRIRRRMATSS